MLPEAIVPVGGMAMNAVGRILRKMPNASPVFEGVARLA